ncbi:hypothetical protein ACI2LC_24165 [Nonomuraea wenchangensis]|uniref:Uncharacterized protein n=1 Tax=Nonomuraea wenchangensis TaxID=568860 RepID=A0A1I0KC46_9ACTN|nr:hypothetical protein [Nonomuraea wenchangensis]SEU21852.1 hypothetical protein SAMN05421811_107423 [Nonomuraea wenchangensis]
MRVRRNDQELSLRFESGAELSVDLGRLDLTEEQDQALSKLVGKAGELDMECRDDDEHCPAQAVLSRDEFEAVRGLKVGLQSAGVEVRGPIIDFCLHVHIVGRSVKE